MSPRLPSFRLLVALAVAATGTACGRGPSVEDARKAVIVDAEGAQLTGAALEQYLLRVPEAITRITADMLISAWIDVSLLQHAARANVDLLDSAFADRALRPDAVKGLLQQLAMSRLAANPEPTDAEADSVFALGDARVFQQILFNIDPRDKSAANKLRVNAVRAVRDRATTGESFDSLVKEYSVDTVFAATNGYLPALELEQLRRNSKELADRTWNLSPNEVSDLVASNRGVHIFRRATIIEARPMLKEWLKPHLAERANARYLDSMSKAQQVRVGQDAVNRMRVLSRDPMKDGGGSTALVRWNGDSLAPDIVRLWLAVITPRERVQFTGAPDTTLSNWLLQVGKLEMLAKSIAPAGIPTPEGRAALMPQYREATQRLMTAWQILGAGKQPTAAATAVLDTLVSGKLAYRPPPSGLSGLLRARFNVSVNSQYIDALVEEASLERARRDAANPGAAAQRGARDSTPVR